MVLPETYSGECLGYAPDLPKIIFNQNGAYSFGIPESDLMHRPGGLLDLYIHPLIRHIFCVSEHDHALVSTGYHAGTDRVSTIRNAIETDIFRPVETKKTALVHVAQTPRDALIVVEMLRR